MKSKKRHLMALSRMIYGLSYAAEFDERNLERARSSAHFILSKMVKTDSLGPYFVGSLDDEGVVVPQTVLIVNEQAYGLCGLVALYDVTRDQNLLAWINRFYDSFNKRFLDRSRAGGFFDGYDLNAKKQLQTKSYNSTVYVATSFLLELRRVDSRHSTAYSATVEKLADIISSQFIDRKTGWIFENFTADWRPWINVVAQMSPDSAIDLIKSKLPSWQSWQYVKDESELRSIGVVGHNFQAAWVLMRISQLPEIPIEKRRIYRARSKEILESMLAKPSVDYKNGGVFDVFKRETNEHMWHMNKVWWQQAEAILALTLADKLGVLSSKSVRNFRDQTTEFYFEHFVDRINGGEFPEVTKEGTPLTGKDKGEHGKSTYHTVELARFMVEYEKK